MNTRTMLAISVLLPFLVLLPRADAQTLRLFFDTNGLSDPADESSAIAGSPALVNPTVNTATGTRRLYVWAQPSDTTHRWIGLSFDVRVTGTATIEQKRVLRPVLSGAAPRWHSAFDGFSFPSRVIDMRMLMVPAGQPGEPFGVAGTALASGDQQHDPITNATLIGYIDVSGEGDVHLAIGSLGIVRDGAAGPESVNLGFGDEADALTTSDTKAQSTLPDATLVSTPCPGDVNADGAVNVGDITYVIFRFGNSGTPGTVDGDADGDGTVNVSDVTFVIFRLDTCL